MTAGLLTCLSHVLYHLVYLGLHDGWTIDLPIPSVISPHVPGLAWWLDCWTAYPIFYIMYLGLHDGWTIDLLILSIKSPHIPGLVWRLDYWPAYPISYITSCTWPCMKAGLLTCLSHQLYHLRYLGLHDAIDLPIPSVISPHVPGLRWWLDYWPAYHVCFITPFAWASMTAELLTSISYLLYHLMYLSLHDGWIIDQLIRSVTSPHVPGLAWRLDYLPTLARLLYQLMYLGLHDGSTIDLPIPIYFITSGTCTLQEDWTSLRTSPSVGFCPRARRTSPTCFTWRKSEK